MPQKSLRSTLRWFRLHPKTALAILPLFAFALLNILAYRHAHAMTHYVPEGAKTSNPESLSGLEKLQVLFAGVTVPRPTAGGSSPKRITA